MRPGACRGRFSSITLLHRHSVFTFGLGPPSTGDVFEAAASIYLGAVPRC